MGDVPLNTRENNQKVFLMLMKVKSTDYTDRFQRIGVICGWVFLASDYTQVI